MSNFIDKFEIAKDAFITKGDDFEYVIAKEVEEFLNEKEVVQITVEIFGYDLEFYTEDELNEKYPDGLPDNNEGSLTLFYNISDLHRDLIYEVDKLNIEKAKKDELKRNNKRSEEMKELYSI